MEKRTGAESLPQDLADAINSILSAEDDDQKDRRILDLIASIDLRNIPGLLALLGESHPQIPDDLRRELSARLVRRWADTNPSAAAAWVKQMPQGAERAEALNSVAIAWADKDVTRATAWVRQLGSEGERQAGITSVAYEAARTEPISALKLALELPADKTRDDLITHAVAQWTSTSPETAAGWAGKIPDQQLRDRILSVVAMTWGESDPISAATLAVRSLPPGRQQDDAVMGIVLRWGQNEPDAARRWVDQFPEGALRRTALENLEKLWPPESQEPTSQP